MNRLDQDVLVTVMAKGTELYVFLWSAPHRDQVLNTIGRFASDPALSLTEDDATELSHEIHEQEAQL